MACLHCHTYVNYDHPSESSPDEKDCFDNLSGSHLQRQVNCGTSVDGINVSGSYPDWSTKSRYCWSFVSKP